MGNTLSTMVDVLVAKLAEDEAWQGNLTDDERQAALRWAHDYLITSMQVAWSKACGRLRSLSFLLGESPNYVSREAARRAWLQ